VTVIYEAQQREREREFDTIPQLHSLGGELLPLHHVAEGDGIKGVKGATGSGSGSIFPPILVVLRSVSCNMCFSTVSSQNRLMGPLYSRF
jgi:hypothetical protein